MQRPEVFRLLIADGTIDLKEPLGFKIITSSSQKVLNPFTFANRNHHFNCEVLVFQTDKKVTIQFVCSTKFKAAEIDLSKDKQVVDIKNITGKSQGAITVEVEKVTTYPKEKFRYYLKSIKAQFTLGMAPKKQIFLIIKQGEKHIQTKHAALHEITAVWEEQHQFDPEQSHLNMYVQCWEDEGQYVGTAVVPLEKSMNKQSKHALKNIKEIEVGMISLRLLDEENFKKDVEKSALVMRPLKIYVLQAILNQQLNQKKHTYVNVKLQGSHDKLATTSVFSDQRNPKWNQSFQIMIREERNITFELCERKEEEEKVLAIGKMLTEDLDDGKLVLDLQNNENQVGKLYIQVQSKHSKKQEHKSPPSKIPTPIEKKLETSQKVEPVRQSPIPSEPSKPKQSPAVRSSKLAHPQTLQHLKQMKAKYSGKSLYDYYNEQLNDALREGLMVIAKDKPANPVRELGLFLINYKK